MAERARLLAAALALAIILAAGGAREAVAWGGRIKDAAASLPLPVHADLLWFALNGTE